MCGGAGWRGGELGSRDRLCVVGLGAEVDRLVVGN